LVWSTSVDELTVRFVELSSKLTNIDVYGEQKAPLYKVGNTEPTSMIDPGATAKVASEPSDFMQYDKPPSTRL
jgi:hypothetical protein